MNVSSRIFGILRMVRIVAVLDCDGWHDAAGAFAVGAGSGLYPLGQVFQLVQHFRERWKLVAR